MRVVYLGGHVANKDKGSNKGGKKEAKKSLKEKRAEKKMKKAPPGGLTP